MAIEQYAYPYDPTGVLQSNKISKELHTLTPALSGEFNFIVPKAAPFFATGFKITHVQSKTRLLHGVDYYFTHPFVAAIEVTKEKVYGGIVFTDKSLSGEVDISYRTMGGPFTLDEAKLLEVLARRHYDPRKLVWGVDVVVPTEFPPAPHQTDGEDLVGMDDIVTALHALESAMRGGRNNEHTHEMLNINGLLAELEGRVRLNGPRKLAMSAPVNLLDYDAPIFIHLPNFLDDTDFEVKLCIIDRNGIAELSLRGRAPGQNGDREVIDWPLVGEIDTGYLANRSLTYEARMDSDKIPYIALNLGRLTTATAVITEVTINSTYSRAYNKGWVTSLPGGSAEPMANRFIVPNLNSLSIDRENTGTLRSGSIWLIDSTERRTRPLPIKPPNESILQFKDNANKCSINPASIVGRWKVNGTIVPEILLDVSNGWFSAQYQQDGDFWTVVEGA